jgi:ribosomal-protein-alanine N-acetyltransferase
MRKYFGRAGRAVGVESTRKPRVASVRRFRAADAVAVMAIVAESPEAAIWSKESYMKLGEETGSLALVSETDGAISGFLVVRMVGDQAEVLNLAVAANYRRKGEGTALLAAALEEFGSRGVGSVYLEVRESNTGAIGFYEKLGFTKTGRRKGYYRAPDEAAVTMERKLTG